MRPKNERLARAVRESGYSYAELARQIRALAAENGIPARTNSSAVAHWIAGTRPGRATAQLIAEALSRRLPLPVSPVQLGLLTSPEADDDPLPGSGDDRDPLEVLDALAAADIDRSPWSRTVPYSVDAAALPLAAGAPRAEPGDAGQGTGTAGETEVAAVREMTRLFTAVDERFGGQHGRTALVQYLRSDVAALCRARFRTGEIKRQMLSAGACVAYLAGWKAYDAGEQGLAQRYYLQAYALTREADDELHGAFVLRVLAHHGMEVGRPEHSLDLLDEALRRVRGRTDPATESLYLATRARALAMAGRGREAVAEAARAARLVDGADEREMPFWAALWGSASACVGNHTAKAAEHLGSYDVAERHFSQAVWSRPDGDHRRITALSVAHTGRMQCRQGLVEQACATWDQALQLMDGVRSTRVTRAVAGMRRELAPYRQRRVQAAVELEERVRLWTAEEDV
ncbi:hypothetical protein HW130_01145 [Streptomyces sp. PKU-EA00015]|uniref:hypothetical protein n=1 Tax=Streptomyces sp. PKU-EA00015 TaxID=2748326 RepID=UPI0015A3D6DC|nr:hypothetical protein [Streptomyces sp. PKU-EA00015]NWF24879.1 hypothetical protein [Streptomyces sp. PKU-EA00015]